MYSEVPHKVLAMMPSPISFAIVGRKGVRRERERIMECNDCYLSIYLSIAHPCMHISIYKTHNQLRCSPTYCLLLQTAEQQLQGWIYYSHNSHPHNHHKPSTSPSSLTHPIHPSIHPSITPIHPSIHHIHSPSPKSVMVTCPSLRRSMFSGLRSRWMIPRW